MISLPGYCRISLVGTSSVYTAVLTLRKRKSQATPDYFLFIVIYAVKY